MVKPQHEYKIILRPSVERLLSCNKLMIDATEMGNFLGVTRQRVNHLKWTDRIPVPIRLGGGGCPRWSSFELLEWVAAGCPGRSAWIAHRGWSGCVRKLEHVLRWYHEPFYR